ncbi:MAG: M23 family metallopeptidase [Acidobacteriia bacterium]|nr:M23 family metallopeptidase [Terriglobia bacterium]
MKTCTLILTLILATPVFAQTRIDFLQVGRSYTNLFYNGKSTDIWLNLSPEMKKVFGDPDGILGMHLQMKKQFGDEAEVIDEQVILQGEFVQYQRLVRFEKDPSAMMVQWSFDHNGVIVGFYVRPAAAVESQFLDYKDKVALRLPFNGNWLVLAGGRSVSENQHAGTVDQRFAYDITAIKHGRIFSGDGTRPEQYFCFGRAILAPGAGTVVEVNDGIPDNPINAPFDSPPAGNLVVIDYGYSEYSFLAHLKLGSIKVKVGDQVRQGQQIGKCGNSGDATTPHLHIHLQNTPVLFKGEGLPMQFQSYIADKRFVGTGEPVRGQIVRNKNHK